MASSSVIAACGSRLSEERLRADARLGVDSVADDSEQVAGPASSTSGTDTATTLVQGQADDSGAAPTAQGSSEVGAPSSESSGASAAASCDAQKPTINIGSVGTYSGIFGPLIGPGTKAVQAWVAAVNAQGGIQCHPVRYFIEDDGGDPARNQALTRKLVEQNNVVAFVYSAAPVSGQASFPYLNSRMIPTVGSSGTIGTEHEQPSYFEVHAGAQYLFQSAWAYQGQVGRGTKVASINCLEAAFCSAAGSFAPTWAQQYGLDLVYRSSASIVQPDYTSHCQAAKDGGASWFFVALDNNSITRLAKSCASINYHPTYATGNLATLPSLAEDPLVDGMQIAHYTIPWTETDHPGVREYDTARRRYAPGLPSSPSALLGWVAAKVFEDAASRAADPTKSADLLEALWSIKDNDFGGIARPVTFTKGQPTGLGELCYWMTIIEDGKHVSPDNGTRHCSPGQ